MSVVLMFNLNIYQDYATVNDIHFTVRQSVLLFGVWQTVTSDITFGH